jgi:putative transposase
MSGHTTSDFVHHRTDDGWVFRTLNVLDEHSRECLAICIKRKLNSTDVIDVLTDLFTTWRARLHPFR